jgi:malate permease and related proteins
MQAITLVLSTVIPVFLIIFLGFFIGKKREVDVQPIVDLIVYVAAPCLIFSSMAKSTAGFSDFFKIFISATIITLAMGIIVYLILKKRRSGKIGLYLPMVIGNTGYLGYPIALFAFGNLGLSNAIIYDVTGSLFLYSIGISIVHHKNDFREMFKIPLIYAVVFGILFNVFKIGILDTIFKPMEMIGAITIPAALLVLGYKLTRIKVNDFFKSFFAACFKIIGGFLIAFIVVSVLNIQGLSRNIILLQAGMPSAVMSMILTHKYGRDADIVASVVLISTVMSIVMIPLMLLYLG